jgi:hypothetical protein
MTRPQVLDIRAKAGHRAQPDGRYYGQRIIGYTEFKAGNVHLGGQWHAIVVLAVDTRVKIVEERE